MKLLGWGYLGTFIGLWLIPFFIRWMTSGFRAALPLKPYLATNAIEPIMVFYVFGVATLVYSGFEWFIQNGISRRSYWTGKLLSLLTVSLIVSLINLLYRLLIAQPLGMQNYVTSGKLTFGHFVQHGNIDIFWFWLRAFSTYTLAVALGMLIGGILGLMTRRWKLITFILVPIIGIGLLTFFGFWLSTQNSASGGGSFYGSWLFSLFRLMTGFDGHVHYQNPLNLVVTNFILSAICLGIGYLFNRLLRLRRV